MAGLLGNLTPEELAFARQKAMDFYAPPAPPMQAPLAPMNPLANAHTNALPAIRAVDDFAPVQNDNALAPQDIQMAPQVARPTPRAAPSGAPVAKRVPSYITEENAARAGIQQGYDQQKDAIGALEPAYRTAQVMRGDALNEATGLNDQHRVEMQAQQLRQQQYSEKFNQDFDRKNAEVASFRVDPNRVLRKAGTSAALAVAMGEFGSTIAGGSNTALDIVNDAVHRDIDAQKSAYESKKTGLAGMQSTYARNMAEFKDEQLARDATYSQSLEAVKMKIASITEGTQNAVAVANAQKAIGDIVVQQNEVKEKFAERAEMLAMQQARAGGAAAAKSPVNQALYVPQLGGVARTAESRQKLVELATAASGIKANINTALALRKSASVLDIKNPYSETNQRLKQLQADTTTQYGVLRKLGALSESDRELADASIGNMTGVMGNPDKVLSAFATGLDKEVQRAGEAEGIERTDKGYNVNAQGHVMPTGEFAGSAMAPQKRTVKITPAGQ